MNHRITPDLMWQMRFDTLEKDFERVRILLKEELDVQDPKFGGGINLMLSDLISSFHKARQSQASTDSGKRWKDLTSLRHKFWHVFATQLELLGGVGLARGLGKNDPGVDKRFSTRSQKWLERIIGPLGLKSDPIVIPGRGPLLPLDLKKTPKMVIVRSPFLDWDLWYIPLMGRAIGLLAAVEDPSGALEPVIEQILPQVNCLLGGHTFSSLKEKEKADCQEKYLRYLYADMCSTAVLGPVYALPVFVLELDFASPEEHGLEDPDQIEGRDAAPRFLPSAVDRAAAILTTLKKMDLILEKPFQTVIEKLERLWGEIADAIGKSDLLDATRERLDACHTQLFEEAVFPTVGLRLPGTQEDWQYALKWYEHICRRDKPRPPSPASEHPSVDMETQLLGAMWWHRIHHPDKARSVHKAVDDFLNTGKAITPYPAGEKLSLSSVSAGARLDRLEGRQELLRYFFGEEINDEEREKHEEDRIIKRIDRLKVGGRFYRMMSPQVYLLDECRQLLATGHAPAEAWKKLAETEENAQALRREAIEFFGGLLIRYRDLDREPAKITKDHMGPGVCELADDLLTRLSVRTGVNWSALTVPGPGTFHAGKTDIIRVRFPDWSLWNLPLLAHEFGHAVSRTIPEFLNYQWGQATEQAREAAPNHKTDAKENEVYREVRQRTLDHLEEFFCDVFATYVLGPAFALNAILLEFNPDEAYRQSSSHPSPMERVQVIAQTLGAMGEEFKAQAYKDLQPSLLKIWKDAVDNCQAEPKGKKGFEGKSSRAEEWGEELFKIVAQVFRLGAGYSAERWGHAQEMATHIMKEPRPNLADLRAIAQKKPRQPFSLIDILNALWGARAGVIGNANAQSRLTALAYDLGSEYSKG